MEVKTKSNELQDSVRNKKAFDSTVLFKLKM